MKTITYTTTSPFRAVIRGNWEIIKGRLKQKYAQLTDNDLAYVEGEEDELMGRLEKACGEDAKDLERFIVKICRTN